jgi:vacuolar-type H+-ATPase subunit E/Vma4
MEKERSLKVVLKTSPSVEGGARIYTADQRLLYDNTLKARLKLREDQIRREICGPGLSSGFCPDRNFSH